MSKLAVLTLVVVALMGCTTRRDQAKWDCNMGTYYGACSDYMTEVMGHPPIVDPDHSLGIICSGRGCPYGYYYPETNTLIVMPQGE